MILMLLGSISGLIVGTVIGHPILGSMAGFLVGTFIIGAIGEIGGGEED